tara:strand:- start:295 stop:513 length:219 start_codon:yes stop_codon:yes gene_type:complete
MDGLRKRGEQLAERGLARVRSEAVAALAEQVADDVRISETAEGVAMAGRRLQERLIANGSLRDIGFLLRSLR